ncbi:hypothetical protein PUMCH_001416 [Australozyma saopauloensis]|uniref:Zn(2)-C6 fungal-type domain-containing protein n=1 Tax=Australozyma saopauloensis TaxID=291208 RepID=A0AAX4H6Q2_9ASCO|nr:hypothetical protein PUMCH_001416 [[Candida] saopauloensis]
MLLTGQMSQWQNPAWYQQNPPTQGNPPIAIKPDQQYTYQIPAQAVTYGRPYVPSDYDSSTMGKVTRASPLIASGTEAMQAGQSVNATTGAAGTPAGIVAPPGTLGGTGVSALSSGATNGGVGIPLSILHTTAGIAGLAPVPGLQVATAPMLPQHQPNNGVGGLMTPQYMQVPYPPGFHPHHPQLSSEYPNYQGQNFQLHPDQWDQLAVGLRKPGEGPAQQQSLNQQQQQHIAQPQPQDHQIQQQQQVVAELQPSMKRKPSKSSSVGTPVPKDASPHAPALSSTNSSSKVTKRSRMGCLTCRQRKKRCCESKPKCTECLRLGLNCVWPKPGTEHKNKPKEVKREENMIDHDVYGKIKVLRGIVEYRSN